MKYLARFDGACAPKNPGGHIGVGAVIFQDDKVIWKMAGYTPAAPKNSNNIAEYRGFIGILRYMLRNNLQNEEILIQGDSMLVVRQMTGQWSIKEGAYKRYAEYAYDLVQGFPNLFIEWIPREKNTFADRLSKLRMIEKGICKR